jgi:hypothetical protein
LWHVRHPPPQFGLPKQNVARCRCCGSWLGFRCASGDE